MPLACAGVLLGTWVWPARPPCTDRCGGAADEHAARQKMRACARKRGRMLSKITVVICKRVVCVSTRTHRRWAVRAEPAWVSVTAVSSCAPPHRTGSS